MLKAIEIYTDMGRFTMAAKHHQTIAEMYETEAVDLDRAVQHYEQAADYFKGEESNSSANKCMLKVAQYAAQLENYDKAIQIYEQVFTFSNCTNFFIFSLYCIIFLRLTFSIRLLVLELFWFWFISIIKLKLFILLFLL